MTALQRFYTGGAVETIGDLEFAGIAADDEIALDGHKLEMRGGLDIAGFRDNPVLHAAHDPLRVVGTVPQIGFSADGHRLLIRASFCEPGISVAADETRALLKSGYLRGISIGFDIVEASPLDPKKGPRGGLHITKSRLLECSVVSVPASPSALVTTRSAASRAAFMRSIVALPATPALSLQRAAVQFSKRSGAVPPSGTLTVWGLLRAREIDDAESRAALPARQAEVERLRQIGRRHHH
jgi:hypothetical protein